MSLQVTTKAVVDPKTIGTPDIGTTAQQLQALNQPWATALANALLALQSHATTVNKVLRQDPPATTQVQVSDPVSGQIVAYLGTYIPFSTGVPIINFFSTLTVADNPDPSVAQNTMVIDPSTLINITNQSGLTVVLNAAGIEAINAAGTVVVSLTATGLVIRDQPGGTVAQFADGVIFMQNLPSANPGAGSKKLWYDPTDSDRVKFAV